MTFTDWLISLGEGGEVAAWDNARLIFLAPTGSASAIAPPAAAPGCPLPGRGGSLSRSVCGDCGQETLATAPELLNHACEEGS